MASNDNVSTILEEVSNLSLNPDPDKKNELQKKIEFQRLNALLEGYGINSSSTTSKKHLEIFKNKILTAMSGEIIEIMCEETQAEQTYIIVLQKTMKYEVRLILKIGEFDANYNLDEREHVNLLIYELDDLDDSKRKFLKLKDLLSKNFNEIFSKISDKSIEQFLVLSHDFELPSDVKEFPYLYLQPGDYILVDRGLYYHHAIYIGSNAIDSANKIVHIYNDEKTKGKFAAIKHAHVREDNWSRLYETKVNKICIRNVFFKTRCRKEVILAARKALNSKKGEYDLLNCNCHTFANFCVTGFVLSNEIQYRIDISALKYFNREYSAIFEKIIEEKDKMNINNISKVHPLNRHSVYDQSETISIGTIRILKSNNLYNLPHCKKNPSIVVKQGDEYKDTKPDTILTFLTPDDIPFINKCEGKV